MAFRDGTNIRSAYPKPPSGFSSRRCAQRAVKKRMQCSADRAQIVTRISLQKSLSNQGVYFCFAQLDPDTAHSIASAFTGTTHSFGRW